MRAAYERLVDERLITASGAAGTHVAGTPPPRVRRARGSAVGPGARVLGAAAALPDGRPRSGRVPGEALGARLHRDARAEAFAPATYADPRGEPALREQIAAYLAIARGLRCAPEQVFITNGFRGGLRLALDVLRVAGRAAWIEEPSFPLTRAGLAAAGLTPVAIDVDDEGLDVAEGIARAPDAAVVVVTPGQQAPLGVALSPRRRQALLRWAKRADAWVIEDDYLGELQLDGRAAPALAATDPAGRVLHIGTFSKTLSPALGVGFLVTPPALAERAAHVAGCLAPAPARATQLALATLLHDGHFLRHLRRMKRLYRARRDALLARLGGARRRASPSSGICRRTRTIARSRTRRRYEDRAGAALAVVHARRAAGLPPRRLDGRRGSPRGRMRDAPRCHGALERLTKSPVACQRIRFVCRRCACESGH